MVNFALEARRPLICIDMDGVLVDWVGGILRWFDVEDPYEREESLGDYSLETLLGLTQEQLQPSQECRQFWEDLNWMPDGTDILMYAAHFDADIVLASVPYPHPASYSGKFSWIQKHLPGMVDCVELGSKKKYMANMNSMLIDDSDWQVEAFIDRGGCGVIVPRPWNSLYRYRKNALEYVCEQIFHFMSSLEDDYEDI